MALLSQHLEIQPPHIVSQLNPRLPISGPGTPGNLRAGTQPAMPFTYSRVIYNDPAEFNRDIGSRFGQRLRDLRRARNLTQLQMAKRFGIDRSFISDVERGRKSISLGLLEVIALGLRVSLSDLFRDI